MWVAGVRESDGRKAEMMSGYDDVDEDEDEDGGAQWDGEW